MSDADVVGCDVEVEEAGGVDGLECIGEGGDSLTEEGGLGGGAGAVGAAAFFLEVVAERLGEVAAEGGWVDD